MRRSTSAAHFCAVFLLLALLLPIAARASSFAIQDAIGPSNNLITPDRTIGWIFSANQDVVIQQLGVWDAGADGLLAKHSVAVWTSTGILLGSTTVQAGTVSPLAGPLVSGGKFRYEPVIPISLSLGQTYVIGALYNDNDDFIFDASSVATAPEITHIDERYSDLSSGLVMPTITANRPGIFGPNFTFNVVPEPTTILLTATVLVVLSATRIRV